MFWRCVSCSFVLLFAVLRTHKLVAICFGQNVLLLDAVQVPFGTCIVIPGANDITSVAIVGNGNK